MKKLKNLKKLFFSLTLIPCLIMPSFAASNSDAPLVTDVKVEEGKNQEDNKNPQNTLDKKIEEAHELKSSKEDANKNKTPSYSSWAIKDLNDAQFMGILPAKDFYQAKDFRKAVSLEDAKNSYRLSREKIESRKIKTGGDFDFKELTRLECLNSISKLLNIEKFDIKNLKDSKIFLGSSDEKYLNEKIPFQEMISLYNRAVNKVLQDEGKTSKGFFYEIDNKKNKIYMLGSIHVGRDFLYPIDKEIITALKSSDKIFMEIDTTNKDEAKKMEEKLYYKDGGNLKNDLGDDLYARVLRIFKGFGMTEDKIISLRPWAVYNTLSIDPRLNAPSASFGVESYFVAMNLINNIEIGELESMEFQSNLLSNFDKKSYIKMIESLTREIELNGYKNINQGLDSMLLAWSEGDKEKMKSILSQSGDSAQEKFNEALLTERDKNMAKKIDAMLKEKGEHTYFILVGSAHLVPENSITGILKNMGYEIIEK